MSLNSNKKSLKQSKILRAEDLLYIIKSNSGYKDDSGNQMIPVSLLVDFINNSGDGLWTDGTEPNMSQIGIYNTYSDKYTIVNVQNGTPEFNRITLDNIIDNGIAITSNGSTGSASLTLNNGIGVLQHTTTVDMSNDLGSFRINADSGTNNYILNAVLNYANDAAADADSTLSAGALYTTTAGGRTIFKKP
jgi:hypothetical protein